MSHVLTEPRREHGRVEAPESQVHIDSPVDADASAGWRRARPRRIHALSVVVLLVGTVLGMIEPTITTSSYELAPGDTLVLFTDGLTDAPRRSAVTLDEVQRAHAAAPGRTPDEIADEIQRLIESRRPLGSGDDTALLIVRIDG